MTNNVKTITSETEKRQVPRMRTLDQAYKMIKETDEHTQVSKTLIRQLLIKGVLPSIPCGKKKLFNYDQLIELLANPENLQGLEYDYMPKKSKNNIIKSKYPDIKPIIV